MLSFFLHSICMYMYVANMYAEYKKNNFAIAVL